MATIMWPTACFPLYWWFDLQANHTILPFRLNEGNVDQHRFTAYIGLCDTNLVDILFPNVCQDISAPS
jgi:hypothetical protein